MANEDPYADLAAKYLAPAPAKSVADYQDEADAWRIEKAMPHPPRIESLPDGSQRISIFDPTKGDYVEQETTRPSFADRALAKTANVAGNALALVQHGLTLGLDVPLNAAIRSATSGKTYGEAREEQMSYVDRARQQMGPVASTLTEGIGAAPLMALTGPGIPALAALGGAQGAGEAVARGESLPEAAKTIAANAAGSAIGGAVVGAAGKLAARAAGKAADVIASLIGKGTANEATGKTAAAIVEKAEKLSDIVGRDADLHAAITDAASGDAKAIDTALTKTQSRIGALGEEKPANYESAFRETPRTVGDLVEHLETAAKDTRAGDPATEAALKRWSERVREKLGSAEGVSEPGIATTIENLETRMAGEKDLAKRADLSRSIGELRAAFKAEPTYDPKTPLDPLELRSLVSDVQSPAAELAYTHDRTAAGKVAHDTAVPFMDFLRTWLDEAGSKGGDAAEAVDAIRESNKKFEALLTARNALEQRASYATANNVQAVTPSFAQFFRQHPAGAGLGAAGLGSLIALHPGAAGATAAAGLTAYAAKRAAAEIINGAAAGKLTPLMIQAALKQGVSPEIVNAARQIADQAARRNVANATR